MNRVSKRLAAALAMSAASACAHIEPQACASPGADADAVTRTIKSYFAALAADDEAAAARLTSPSFYSFDVGKRYTGPQLSSTIKQLHQAGTILQWNIGSVDTHFDCNTAWAAWENVGAAGKATQLKPVKWLESAVLRRHRGQWRLEFLHSTRAQEPSTAASSVQAQGADQDEQDLRRLQQAWMQAWVRQDRAALEHILAPGFTLVVSTMPERPISREQWLALTRRYTAQAFRYDQMVVRLFGDFAVVSSLGHVTGARVDGHDRSGTFFLTDVWRRTGGRWQVVSRYSSRPEGDSSSAKALEQPGL